MKNVREIYEALLAGKTLYNESAEITVWLNSKEMLVVDRGGVFLERVESGMAFDNPSSWKIRRIKKKIESWTAFDLDLNHVTTEFGDWTSRKDIEKSLEGTAKGRFIPIFISGEYEVE